MSKASVLIVEDDPIVAEDLRKTLERSGYRVPAVAVSGEEAVRMESQFEPDLVLIDFVLGGSVDGIEAASRIRTRRDVPVIYLAAYSDRDLVERAKSTAPIAYLWKPFEKRNLLTMIEIALHQYVTARERAEAEIRASEERFKYAFEHAPIGMALVTPAGRWLDVNNALSETLGHSRTELLAISFDALAHPDDLGKQADLAWQALNGGAGNFHLEMRFRPKAGDVLWIHLSAALVLDRDGKPSYFIYQWEDFSARKRAEEAEHAQRSRAEALVRVAERLNAQLDFDAVIDAICKETARAMNVPAASVGLYDEKRNVLNHGADWGLPADFRAHSGPLHRAIYDGYRNGPEKAGPAVRTTPDAAGAGLQARQGFHAMASAPMVREGKLIGALNVFTFEPSREFAEGDLALLKGIADQAAQAITNARLLAETRRRLVRVNALRDVDKAITGSLDLRLTLNILLEQVITQLNLDAAAVLLLNPRTLLLEYAAGRGFRTDAVEKSRVRLGEGLAGRSLFERRVIPQHDPLHSPDFTRAALLADEGFLEYVSAPLTAKGVRVGVLEAFHRVRHEADGDWLAFLETLAAQAAVAVDNANLFERLQSSNLELVLAYDATIEGWSRAIDLRFKTTEGHILLAPDMTLRLGREAGIIEEELIHVRRGALLHDLGKLGVPEGVLNKPGLLTTDEWALIRRHPQFAFDILASIAYLRPAVDIPYCHHEKWDGSGYPRGLKGEGIPLAARIFAVVDVWDALRSERPYRAAWPEEKTIEHIQAGAGTHFDPQIVELFLQAMGKRASKKESPFPR